MTLDELLDTLQRDMLHDRSDAVAGDGDQLWSDTTLIRYIDQAQRRFARRSLCIRALTSLTTVAYQQEYPLDPSILSVYSARNMGNGAWINGVYLAGTYDTSVPPVFTPTPTIPILYPDSGDLGRSGHASRSYNRRDTDDYWDVNNTATLNPGKPLVFDTDEYSAETGGSSGNVVVKLYPIPAAPYAPTVIQLRVARLPTVRLTPANLQAVPEIPEDYHLDMLDYAAYLALRIVDHEDGDPARATEFQQAFDRHVEEARVEILRKTFAPQPWGFGRNGFSYATN